MTVKTVGLDLAKVVFQVHGISENGRVLQDLAALHDRDGSLRIIAPLGSHVATAWPRCQVNAGELCEALCKTRED